MPHDDQTSLRAHISDGEWQKRCDLAALYRLVALYGWDDQIFTHISARIPAAESVVRQADGAYAPAVTDHFLINPYGTFFDEMTASDLVKIDIDGNKLTGYLSNLDSGRQYMFAVQAVGLAGKAGEFTAEVPLVIAYPTTPMPRPSDPILSTKLATVKVEWDGNDLVRAAVEAIRDRVLRVDRRLDVAHAGCEQNPAAPVVTHFQRRLGAPAGQPVVPVRGPAV